MKKKVFGWTNREPYFTHPKPGPRLTYQQITPPCPRIRIKTKNRGVRYVTVPHDRIRQPFNKKLIKSLTRDHGNSVEGLFFPLALDSGVIIDSISRSEKTPIPNSRVQGYFEYREKVRSAEDRGQAKLLGKLVSKGYEKYDSRKEDYIVVKFPTGMGLNEAQHVLKEVWDKMGVFIWGRNNKQWKKLFRKHSVDSYGEIADQQFMVDAVKIPLERIRDRIMARGYQKRSDTRLQKSKRIVRLIDLGLKKGSTKKATRMEASNLYQKSDNAVKLIYSRHKKTLQN